MTALKTKARLLVVEDEANARSGLQTLLMQEGYAVDLAEVLMAASDVVEDVTLFDVYQGENLPEGTRSLAYNVRFTSVEKTLSEADVADARAALIHAAQALGAELRS